MIRFKLDENMPYEATEVLRVAGYDAVTVLDQNMGGKSDQIVFSTICREKRAMMTLDLDFSDIRTYPPEKHHGIVVIRSAKNDKSEIVGVLKKIIPLLKREPLIGHLWIVDKRKVRIRGKERRSLRH